MQSEKKRNPTTTVNEFSIWFDSIWFDYILCINLVLFKLTSDFKWMQIHIWKKLAPAHTNTQTFKISADYVAIIIIYIAIQQYIDWGDGRLHVINHLSNTNSVPFTTFTATIVCCWWWIWWWWWWWFSFHSFAKFKLQLFNIIIFGVLNLYFEHKILWNLLFCAALKHHTMIIIINEATVCMDRARQFNVHQLNTIKYY